MLEETTKEELEADGSIDCVDDKIVVSWDDEVFSKVDNAPVDIMVGWIVEFWKISVVEIISDTFCEFDEDTIVDGVEQITSVVVIT